MVVIFRTVVAFFTAERLQNPEKRVFLPIVFYVLLGHISASRNGPRLTERVGIMDNSVRGLEGDEQCIDPWLQQWWVRSVDCTMSVCHWQIFTDLCHQSRPGDRQQGCLWRKLPRRLQSRSREERKARGRGKSVKSDISVVYQ